MERQARVDHYICGFFGENWLWFAKIRNGVLRRDIAACPLQIVWLKKSCKTCIHPSIPLKYTASLSGAKSFPERILKVTLGAEKVWVVSVVVLISTKEVFLSIAKLH
jgi:hypothetical protein